MSKINCTVTNCYYNKTNGCTASSVKVDGENAMESNRTCCDTFMEQKPGVVSSVSSPKSNASIICAAGKCMYNKNEKCDAQNILVNGKNACCCEETCCSTFQCK